jgi:hypothetical protein
LEAAIIDKKRFEKTIIQLFSVSMGNNFILLLFKQSYYIMKKKNLLSIAVFLSTVFFGFACENNGWVTLFNGENLEGWIQKNGTATYRVEDGAIVGLTTPGSPNSFLCTEKEYGNFELEFEVKLMNNELNSGVQIRSQTREPEDGAEFGRVNGPQVEIEASGENGSEAGYVYGEQIGGWMTPEDKLVPHKTFKDQEWNSYRIVANGPRIQVWINGEQISDLVDEAKFETHPTGFIGLQVHDVGDGGPFEVLWKDIKIKELE